MTQRRQSYSAHLLCSGRNASLKGTRFVSEVRDTLSSVQRICTRSTRFSANGLSKSVAISSTCTNRNSSKIRFSKKSWVGEFLLVAGRSHARVASTKRYSRNSRQTQIQRERRPNFAITYGTAGRLSGK